MNVLFLGSSHPALFEFLQSCGDTVDACSERLETLGHIGEKYDFLISYGYRHRISAEMVRRLPSKIINLHISYLPWNRGADPNLWSFLEDTPKGVTIHFIDEEIDAGPIIAQREVVFGDTESLKTTYDRLKTEIEDLFKLTWPKISRGEIRSTPQPPGGTYHRAADRTKFEPLLTHGWDTAVIELLGKALIVKGNLL